MQAHWEALAAVAVTEESCIAIDAIQARIKELEAELHRLDMEIFDSGIRDPFYEGE